uniref:Protein E7 n=1 Tax=Mops bat papillomavirus TaxID=3141892 RepID=A0AAU7E213_9PAPI
MIGQQATLNDIVLQEKPESVSLTCHEILDEEEPNTQPYIITSRCGVCSRMLRIAVRGTSGGIQTLKYLLRDLEVSFVCTKCAIDQRYYG